MGLTRSIAMGLTRSIAMGLTICSVGLVTLYKATGLIYCCVSVGLIEIHLTLSIAMGL